MLKMTSDLYYTQLCEITTFTINDKRTNSSVSYVKNDEDFSDEALSFYTEIKKDNSTDKWSAILHVINKTEDTEYTKSIEYDSFYKILMESKQNLQTSIKNLIQNQEEDTTEEKDNIHSYRSTLFSSESLSGTWKGESNIDKIVILKGGRGFIIFKNGATMNIIVKIDESTEVKTVKITQNGKSNASFYPDLPRQIALNAAVTAEPIEWNFVISNQNTLSGTKKTLLPKNDSFSEGTIEVTWNKVN